MLVDVVFFVSNCYNSNNCLEKTYVTNLENILLVALRYFCLNSNFNVVRHNCLRRSKYDGHYYVARRGADTVNADAAASSRVSSNRPGCETDF